MSDDATVSATECKAIPLTRGLVALVDVADYESLSGLNWTAKCAPHTRSFYASGRAPGNRRSILMHRLILDAPDDLFVDHVNSDTLDNRRSNLRLATNQQNTCNARPWRKGSSRYKGVSWDKGHKKWAAQIDWRGADGKRRHSRIGRFSDEREAAFAYDAAALKQHGEFAWLNAEHFDLFA